MHISLFITVAATPEILREKVTKVDHHHNVNQSKVNNAKDLINSLYLLQDQVRQYLTIKAMKYLYINQEMGGVFQLESEVGTRAERVNYRYIFNNAAKIFALPRLQFMFNSERTIVKIWKVYVSTCTYFSMPPGRLL